MRLEKLNIAEKIDNPVKRKYVEAGEIGKDETLVAEDVNSMVSKINEIIDYQDEAFNLKVNTIVDLRRLEGKEGQIITLLGYYEAGDKEPLNYKFTNVQGVDDEGSIINSSNGSWICVRNYITNLDFGKNLDSFFNNNNYLKKIVTDLDLNNLEYDVKSDLIAENCLIRNGTLNFNKVNVTLDNSLNYDVFLKGSVKNKIIYGSWYSTINPQTNNKKLQHLIDISINSGAKLVLKYNSEYPVTKENISQITIQEGGGAISVGNYSLLLKSNCDIDLNNSTIYNNESSKSIIFLSENYNNLSENIDNVKVYNGILKNNGSEISAFNSSALCIVRGRKLEITNLIFDNIRWVAMRIMSSSSIIIKNLKIYKSAKHALNIGNDYRTYCDDVTMRDIETYDTVENPLIATLKNSIIDNYKSVNSGWGWKLQNGSSYVNVNNIEIIGGELSTDNSGLKIQGTSDYPCANININNIISRDNYAEGLYIQYAKDINISNYFGDKNGLRSSSADIWISCDGLKGNNITSSDFYIGIVFRPDSSNIYIADYTSNNGLNTIISSNSLGIVNVNTIYVKGDYSQNTLIRNTSSGYLGIANIVNSSSSPNIGISFLNDNGNTNVNQVINNITQSLILNIKATNGASYMQVTNLNYNVNTININSVNRFYAPKIIIEQISGLFKPCKINIINNPANSFRLAPLEGTFAGNEIYMLTISNYVLN